jgi:hypothetical protein
MRSFVLAATVAATVASFTLPTLAQGVVRVEPRPFYGAVVTLEEGVRVFRPLPADRYIVINPGHGTPLSLGIQDTRVFEHSRIQNEYHGSADVAPGAAYGYGAAGVYPGYGYGRDKKRRVPGVGFKVRKPGHAKH